MDFALLVSDLFYHIAATNRTWKSKVPHVSKSNNHVVVLNQSRAISISILLRRREKVVQRKNSLPSMTFTTHERRTTSFFKWREKDLTVNDGRKLLAYFRRHLRVHSSFRMGKREFAR